VRAASPSPESSACSAYQIRSSYTTNEDSVSKEFCERMQAPEGQTESLLARTGGAGWERLHAGSGSEGGPSSHRVAGRADACIAATGPCEPGLQPAAEHRKSHPVQEMGAASCVRISRPVEQGTSSTRLPEVLAAREDLFRRSSRGQTGRFRATRRRRCERPVCQQVRAQVISLGSTRFWGAPWHY
jgi:hypothetical protein